MKLRSPRPFIVSAIFSLVPLSLAMLPGCAHWRAVAAGERCPFGFSDGAASGAVAAGSDSFGPRGSHDVGPDDPLTAMVFDLTRQGNLPAIREYLGAGRSPNLTNAKGDRLLCVAAYHRQRDIVAALLAQPGIEVDAKSRNGFTPLIGAAFHGDLEIATLLLDAGASIDGNDDTGRTPLMFAALFGRGEMVDLLLARDASRDARDAQGRTAAELAKAQGAEDVVARLEARGDR